MNEAGIPPCAWCERLGLGYVPCPFHAEIAALKFQLAEALEWKQRWKDAAEMAKDVYLAAVNTKR